MSCTNQVTLFESQFMLGTGLINVSRAQQPTSFRPIKDTLFIVKTRLYVWEGVCVGITGFNPQSLNLQAQVTIASVG
jgi:hypothetical protein